MKQQLHVAKYADSGINKPLLWMYMVLKNQSNSWLALVMVKQELSALTLQNHPGEVVNACTHDIEVKCCQIEAANYLPQDIGIIICKILMLGTVEQFHVIFHNAFGKVNDNPKPYTYHELITKADSLYQLLITSKHWLATSTDDETVIAGLVAKVDCLVMSQK